MNAGEAMDRLSELLRERNRAELALERARREVVSFIDLCDASLQEDGRRAKGRRYMHPSGYPELPQELIISL